MIMADYTGFTDLDAPKRDVLTVLSHGDPVKEVEIGANLKEEVDKVVSYARIYDHLKELEELGFVVKQTGEWATYQITPLGRAVVQEYHRLLCDFLGESNLSSDEFGLMYSGGGTCRSISPGGSDDE